ncbi:hypothetical protein HMPREF1231_0699, partial [Streptococcus pyogenes GA06023]
MKLWKKNNFLAGTRFNENANKQFIMLQEDF